MRRTTIVIPLLILSLSGCAWIGQKPVVYSQSQGRVDNNIYTSPRQSFRIRLPRLSTNTALRDERPTSNTVLLTIEDDLCREFVVSERPGFLGSESLQPWVDEHVVVNHPKLQQYVNTVGRWIASRSERADLNWHFGVIDSHDINAFAAPGGYIFVTKGLYRLLRNESELAGVLAHEWRMSSISIT